MRISAERYAHMKEAMLPLADKIPAHRAALTGDPRVSNLEKRIRWDWFYGARLNQWACDVLYKPSPLYGQGLTDSHIDTALKAIVLELEPRAQSLPLTERSPTS